MTKLSVNLNKFALVRNSRGHDYPNVVAMAQRAIKAGVHGITIHPRPDQRHATYQDAFDLKELTQENGAIELNIEGYPTEKFLQVVHEVKPDQCTLVPDDPNQITSDHGWDVITHSDRLAEIVAGLHQHSIRASIFIDPVTDQIAKAKDTGTDRVELYTERYAAAYGTPEQEAQYDIYHKAALCASENGLAINAGHDLNLENLGHFLTIPNILEVSIGHAIVVESWDYGFEKTLEKYLEIIKASIEG